MHRRPAADLVIFDERDSLNGVDGVLELLVPIFGAMHVVIG